MSIKQREKKIKLETGGKLFFMEKTIEIIIFIIILKYHVPSVGRL